MKFAAAALLGLTAAKYDDAMEALKISVSPYGQKQIESEAMDVRQTARKIQHAPATKTLRKAVMKWAHSRAAQNVQKLDRKFLASPAGQKLIKEWKDVGRVLKQNIQHTHNGIHFSNQAMKSLSNELDDVSDHYEYLGNTHWKAKYELAYQRLFTSQAFAKVKFAGKKFKYSKAGKMLRKEVNELGQALQQHVKVTDIPPKWKKHMHGLKVEVSKAGQAEIHQEGEDIKEWWQHTEHRPVTQGLKKHLMEWGTSEEAHHLEQLDKKFKASPEGQKLMKEWRDFGEALHKAVQPTENGFHIDNEELQEAEEEAKDIEEQYKHLETTHWAKDFHHGFDQWFHNDEAKELHHFVETKWNPSMEAQRGAKELHEFGQAVKKNVKVSDVPKHWKKQMKNDMMFF